MSASLAPTALIPILMKFLRREMRLVWEAGGGIRHDTQSLIQ